MSAEETGHEAKRPQGSTEHQILAAESISLDEASAQTDSFVEARYIIMHWFNGLP